MIVSNFTAKSPENLKLTITIWEAYQLFKFYVTDLVCLMEFFYQDFKIPDKFELGGISLLVSVLEDIWNSVVKQW